MWLYSMVCVGPVRELQRRVSQDVAYMIIRDSSRENLLVAYAKTKAQISYTVIVQLLSCLYFCFTALLNIDFYGYANLGLCPIRIGQRL